MSENNVTRTGPAFASSLSTVANNECREFMNTALCGLVEGTDEWLIKLDSLSHLGELTTREIFNHCRRANADKPQDAYRNRLAQLGLWPKSLKGNNMKPVNEKDCAERGGQYKTRAKVFECLRKMHSAEKKAAEQAKADADAQTRGFKSAQHEAEEKAKQAAVTSNQLADPPAEITIPLDILTQESSETSEPTVKIATGPTNKEAVKALLQSIVDNATAMTPEALQQIATQALQLVDGL